MEPIVIRVRIGQESDIPMDERQYPYIGRSRRGVIVLFTNYQQGVLLSDSYLMLVKLGDHHKMWNEVLFKVVSGNHNGEQNAN